jgi:hypothetical protein
VQAQPPEVSGMRCAVSSPSSWIIACSCTADFRNRLLYPA